MTANPQDTDQLLLPFTTSDTLKPSRFSAACEMARFHGLWVTVVLLGAVGLVGGVRMLYLAEMDCTPRQVHIAIGSSPDEAVVSWSTRSAPCRASVSLWRGNNDDPADFAVFAGDVLTLNQNDMCQAPATKRHFKLHQHHATLTGLHPDTSYSYTIDGSGSNFTFTSQPSVGSSFNFIAFGDMGVDSKSKESEKCKGAVGTLSSLKDEISKHRSSRPDFIMHAGDLSYANGHPGVWDEFMDFIEPVASRVPYMVAIGNHEYDYDHGTNRDPSGAAPYHPDWGNYGLDSQGECGVQTAKRFQMPQRYKATTTNNSSSSSSSSSSAPASDNSPFWYAFAHGAAHFVVISTEHDITPGSRQHDWLAAELAAVDRCASPWLVLVMHRPMYVVFPHKENALVGDHLAASLEELLSTYGVDLVLSGHVHSYTRSCPVYRGKCQVKRGATRAAGGTSSAPGGGDAVGKKVGYGTVHLVIGTGGHVLSDVDDDQHDWLEASLQRYGYGRFAVSREQLVVEFVSSESGKVLDSTVLSSTWADSLQCAQRGQQAGAQAEVAVEASRR